MLTMPVGASNIATIIGIDPGSDTLGVAELRINVETLEIVSSDAQTLHGARAGRHSWVTEIHGDRYGRIESHRLALLQIFSYTQPLIVACEAPFINRRRPNAYGALTEVVATVRFALMDHDIWLPLDMLEPSVAKKAVGVGGKTGGPDGKKLMQRAVLAMPIFKYSGVVPMHLLDEHSIDALAVAYARYLTLREALCFHQNSKSPVG